MRGANPKYLLIFICFFSGNTATSGGAIDNLTVSPLLSTAVSQGIRLLLAGQSLT
jgi:hypothetical protein